MYIGLQFFGGRGSGGGKGSGGGGGGGSITGASPQITNTAKQIQSELGPGWSLSASYTDSQKRYTEYKAYYNGNANASLIRVFNKPNGGTKIFVNHELKKTAKTAAKEISPKKKS